MCVDTDLIPTHIVAPLYQNNTVHFFVSLKPLQWIHCSYAKDLNTDNDSTYTDVNMACKKFNWDVDCLTGCTYNRLGVSPPRYHEHVYPQRSFSLGINPGERINVKQYLNNKLRFILPILSRWDIEMFNFLLLARWRLSGALRWRINYVLDVGLSCRTRTLGFHQNVIGRLKRKPALLC